jgi:hypothetical protein
VTKRRIEHDPPWTPMARAEAVARSEAMAVIAKLAGRPEAPEMWVNSIYTVTVERYVPEPGEHEGAVRVLSIRRNDRGHAHDWRHFQRIKNEIAGPEVEAVELYPRESRLMDTANQFWLWCLPPGAEVQLGYNIGRNVRDDEDEATAFGAKQRAFDG